MKIALVLFLSLALAGMQAAVVTAETRTVGTGALQVTAAPGARVFLDGEFRGIATEEEGGFFLEGVPAGRHRLKVLRTGHPPFEAEVTVVAGRAVEAKVASGASSRAEPSPTVQSTSSPSAWSDAEWVAEGDAAKGRGDYVGATHAYAKAQMRGNDPAGGRLSGLCKDAVARAVIFGAADRDDAACQFLRGRASDLGDGINKDGVEALRWYRKAAEQGHAAAQDRLARRYADGEGVVRDVAQAVKWFEKAAVQGHADSQIAVGYVHETGWGGTAKNSAEALRWYREAAGLGNANAQKILGDRYARGEGVEKDLVEAVNWYRKAAEQGNRSAQYELGAMYEKGNGVTKDPAEAVSWYRKSAERGFVQAQVSLATLYYNGEGVARHPAEAAGWYRKAAEQGMRRRRMPWGSSTSKGKVWPKILPRR